MKKRARGAERVTNERCTRCVVLVVIVFHTHDHEAGRETGRKGLAAQLCDAKSFPPVRRFKLAERAGTLLAQYTTRSRQSSARDVLANVCGHSLSLYCGSAFAVTVVRPKSDEHLGVQADPVSPVLR